MTYKDIFIRFIEQTGISDIEDYRPTYGMYIDNLDDNDFIPNSIVVWLKNGDKLIYIAKNT